MAKVQKSSKVVYSPAISLFGAATPVNFWPLLQDNEVLNGFFSRLLVFESHVRPNAQTPPVPYEVPAGLKARLVELHQFGNDPLPLAHDNPASRRSHNTHLWPQIFFARRGRLHSQLHHESHCLRVSASQAAIIIPISSAPPSGVPSSARVLGLGTLRNSPAPAAR
jgi:hypothetical protein